MKLTTIVRCDREETFRIPPDQLYEPLVCGPFGPRVKLADHQVAGLAIYDRNDARSAGTVDGLHFPMPGFKPFVGCLRALVDHGFTRKAAPAVVTAVSFPAQLL